MPLALTMYSVAGKLVVQLITYLLDMFQSRVNKKPGVEVSHLQLKTLSLSVVLFVLIILIGCCVTGAPNMENLDFSSSFYFWFISLSTIGYGDITFKRDKHLASPHMLMLAVLNLLFGIGILAAIIAAISLVLEKRDLKMSTIIIDNDEDEEELISDGDEEIGDEMCSPTRDKSNNGHFLPHATLEKMRERQKQEKMDDKNDVEADELTSITHLSSEESLNDHCPKLHSNGNQLRPPQQPKQITLTEKFKEDTLMLLKRRLTPTNSTKGLLSDEDDQHQHHHNQHKAMIDNSKSTSRINPSFDCEHITTI